MKRIRMPSVFAVVIALCFSGICVAMLPVEDVELLKQAVLTLSLEVNDRDRQIEDLMFRLDRALILYDEAESDVAALRHENAKLRLQLSDALILYDGAEADVDLLQVQVAELIKSLELKQSEIEQYQAAASAKNFLMLVAGAVGGAAAAILLGILNGSN